MGEVSTIPDRDPRLTPATSTEIVEELKILFAGFDVKKDSKDEAENSMVAYVLPLQQYPKWALHNAILKFLDGSIVGTSKKYAPKPPEICEAVRAQLEPIMAEATKRAAAAAKRRRDEADLGPPVQMTEQARNRMKLKMLVLNHCGPDVAAECMRQGGLMPYIEVAAANNLPIPEGLVEPEDETLP